MINQLSIIFPVYNEEIRLKKTFSEIIKFKKKIKKKKIEIIFIDDGSKDESSLIIEKFASKMSSKNFVIKSYKLKKNMGKGYALKIGIKKCSLNWVLTTDVDLSVSLSQIFNWEKKANFKSKKIVFGSRNHRDSKVSKNFLRFILGKLFNFFVNQILNINLLDTQCGFKVYKKNVAKKIFSKLLNYGFTHDLELVLICLKEKIKIVEYPVKWTHKSGSKVNIFLDPVKMFLNMLYLKFRYY